MNNIHPASETRLPVSFSARSLASGSRCSSLRDLRKKNGEMFRSGAPARAYATAVAGRRRCRRSPASQHLAVLFAQYSRPSVWLPAAQERAATDDGKTRIRGWVKKIHPQSRITLLQADCANCDFPGAVRRNAGAARAESVQPNSCHSAAAGSAAGRGWRRADGAGGACTWQEVSTLSTLSQTRSAKRA